MSNYIISAEQAKKITTNSPRYSMQADESKLKTIMQNYFVWLYTAQEDLDDECIEYKNEDRAIALAGFINDLWQSLTEEERKQIKEILK